MQLIFHIVHTWDYMLRVSTLTYYHFKSRSLSALVTTFLRSPSGLLCHTMFSKHKNTFVPMALIQYKHSINLNAQRRNPITICEQKQSLFHYDYFINETLILVFISSCGFQCSRITITTNKWLIILHKCIHFVQKNMNILYMLQFVPALIMLYSL